jgi:nicotinate-nucleotide adenylyltransferase
MGWVLLSDVWRVVTVPVSSYSVHHTSAVRSLANTMQVVATCGDLGVHMRRYAVYGGSFDPIHFGHLSMIERAVGLGYTVIIVPAYRHAFGKRSAPFAHRIRMCELALEAQQLQEHTHLCTIEHTLARGEEAPVYTYDVLCALRDKLHTAPQLLIGPDVLAEWERWYRHEDIDREFGRICLPETRTIRSTEIRQRLHAGTSPAALGEFTPQAVIAYILAQGLYQE